MTETVDSDRAVDLDPLTAASWFRFAAAARWGGRATVAFILFAYYRGLGYLDILAANRTPTSRMEGDVSVWTGTPEQIAETMLAYREVGFHTFIAELAAPYDAETMESLIGVVKPMVERESVSA